MKLYSDTLTLQDLHAATPGPVGLDALPINRPRVRSRGWTVRLNDWSGSRHANSGTHGAATWSAPAASWDQHGEWMAELYRLDPDMRVTYYTSALDFHRQTENRYATPADVANGLAEDARVAA